MNAKKLEKLCIGAIRATCIDIVNKAKSGHPGMALGSAPILYTLFKNHLIANPNDPNWINRDRFILSSGHASALLYTMLHVTGYKVSMDDLKSFRQLDSLTPGHPEYRRTEGVDSTSGPLGQGVAQAVGVAMAERAMAGQYPEGKKLINHRTYVLCGDGCLEEGVSQEAISLAGHHKLNKLILIYDSNKVTLDGDLDLSFSEDVRKRFKAAGWKVLEVKDGNSVSQIDGALQVAKASSKKPTLIIVHTTIGYGSSKQGTSKVHGSPLGEEDGAHAKAVYGYNFPEFTIPQEVYDSFLESFINRGIVAENKWKNFLESYSKNYPDQYKTFQNACKGDVSSYLNYEMIFQNDDKDSSRVASGKILNNFHKNIPFLIGGSADVAGSVMTKIDNGVTFSKKHPEGRNINFGIREFEMASAQNGMLLHGGLKTYVGSFLVFADYMKSAIRTAALSKLPAIYLFSHDSIALGEDGPTHQPVETLAMLRSIPNVNVIRPCDSRETYAAWKIALESKETPTALILSRQNLPLQTSKIDGVYKGAYVISEAKRRIQAILLATGSEVDLAIKTQKFLFEKYNLDVRVVSMPSMYLFEKQSNEYKRSVFPINKDRVFSIEMLSTFGWHKYSDHPYGVDTFGTSAPAKDAIRKFHFTQEDIAAHIFRYLSTQNYSFLK